MIDIRQLRENPERFRQGARDKGAEIDFDRLLALDEERLAVLTKLETARAEQNRISKEIGPQIGKLKGQLKGLEGDARAAAEASLRELESRPMTLK
ncbi:MAG: serine--tRNA ligase, partial [Phycisphaerae bacterium]|nr:serine--tRNA ligase [Phycisphaerae bacterium]